MADLRRADAEIVLLARGERQLRRGSANDRPANRYRPVAESVRRTAPPNIVTGRAQLGLAISGSDKPELGWATIRKGQATRPRDAVQAAIGTRLQTLYDLVEQETLPARFVELLQKLENSYDR